MTGFRWLTNVAGLLIMALLGEWLCVQRELADIPLSESLVWGGPTYPIMFQDFLQTLF